MNTTQPELYSSDIEIRHTRADGTLVHGTTKGDGSNGILKAHRFRWFPSLGLWGIQSSRDKEAQHRRINGAATALRDAGFTVTVHIDESQQRSVADIEADNAARAETRAERFEARAAKATKNSQRMWSEADRITSGYQGEPIKIGHHSEKRHRRDLDRAHDLHGRSIAEDDKADYYADRAEASAHHQHRREAIPVTLRRIERLEADLRWWQRERASTAEAPERRERCDREITDLTEKITYWKDHIEQTTAANPELKVWGPADFARGDYVRFLGHWHEVLRVNTKSVTIAVNRREFPRVHSTDQKHSGPERLPYHKVTARATADHIANLTSQPDNTTTD